MLFKYCYFNSRQLNQLRERCVTCGSRNPMSRMQHYENSDKKLRNFFKDSQIYSAIKGTVPQNISPQKSGHFGCIYL